MPVGAIEKNSKTNESAFALKKKKPVEKWIVQKYTVTIITITVCRNKEISDVIAYTHEQFQTAGKIHDKSCSNPFLPVRAEFANSCSDLILLSASCPLQQLVFLQ